MQNGNSDLRENEISRPPDREEEEPRALRGKQSSGGRLRIPHIQASYTRAARSGKTEAVFKVVGHLRGAGVLRVLNYVARVSAEEKEGLELEDVRGRVIQGREKIENKYLEWRESFDRREREAGKPAPRHAMHLMLSAKADLTKENLLKVQKAARDVAQKHFTAKGYDWAMGLHQDGKQPHVHIVVNMKPAMEVGQENTKKLKLNPKELDEIREDFAKRLTKLGLEHVATRRKDRPHVLAKVNQGIERLEQRQTMFEKAMESASPSFDAFAHRKAVAQAVARMREQAKKETKILDLKRAPALDALKNFEKSLTTKGMDIDKEVAATARKLGKDATQFLKLIEEGRAGKADEREVRPGTEIRKKPDSLRKQRKTLAERIKAAEMAIKGTPIGEGRTKALKELKVYKKSVLSALSPRAKTQVRGKASLHLTNAANAVDSLKQALDERKTQPSEEATKKVYRAIYEAKRELDGAGQAMKKDAGLSKADKKEIGTAMRSLRNEVGDLTGTKELEKHLKEAQRLIREQEAEKTAKTQQKGNLTPRERLQQQRAREAINERAVKALEEARRAMRKADIPKDQKARYAKRIKGLEKSLGLIRDISLGR